MPTRRYHSSPVTLEFTGKCSQRLGTNTKIYLPQASARLDPEWNAICNSRQIYRERQLRLSGTNGTLSYRGSVNGAMLRLTASLATVCVTVLTTRVLAQVPSTPVSDNPAGAAGAAQVRLWKAYRSLPLQFEANQGQTNSRVKFTSRTPGAALFLTSDGAVLEFGQ